VAEMVLTANGPKGPLFAAVVPTARFVEAAVADRRFGALLKPFRSDDDARAALTAAGGQNIRKEQK
jgi:hypothetical protein